MCLQRERKSDRAGAHDYSWFRWHLNTPERLETGAELCHERLRLLPRREVCALGKAGVPEQVGIRALGPTLRGLIDLVRICHDGYWKLNAPGVEEAALAPQLPCAPIETRRGDRGVRQPVEGDVVEDVVARQALTAAIKHAHDELLAARAVVAHPGRETDGGIGERVQRLRPEPHPVPVAEARLRKK